MTVRYIAFFLAALSLVNAYSFVRLYSSTYVSNERVIARNSNSRTPAAVQNNKNQATPDFSTRLSMDLNCAKNKKMTGLEVKGQWAQLRGKFCSQDKIKLVEITNLNNGFTASVFSSGVQQYQTDLIQLEQGMNKIRVKITPSKGDVEEQTLLIQSHHI